MRRTLCALFGYANSLKPSHDAQPCYCGEPNCVGFIGGKTQTDLAAMDDLYLDGMCLILHMLTDAAKTTR